MKQIRCDIDNLHIPLAVLVGMVGAVRGVKMTNIPADVSDIVLRVCPLGNPQSGSPVFYDFSASQDDNGDWFTTVSKNILTEECSSGWYEVRGKDQEDNLVGVGRGKFVTVAFSTGTATAVPTEA